ncbi:MAG: hypothetical protein V2I36_16140 [Desulfopila sp.]|jgi:hypothetical protein|nr:hypothetical protein [Desulfopila sp.]
MTNRSIRISALTLLLILSQVICAFAFEQKSRHATLRYSDPKLVREFNDRVYFGRSLLRILRKRNVVTSEEEGMAKIDIIIEKAMVVLDMFPDNMHITVVLLPRASDVARVYKERYGRSANHIAYYSLSEKTIYLSVSNVNLEVISHEVGHAVVDHFFKVRPPYNIHELMAQFTAKHIQD